MKLEDLFIREEATIREALSQLDKTGRRILIVVEGRKLLGVLTDGDIRRWILKNGDLNESIKSTYGKAPKYLREEDRAKAKTILEDHKIEAMPVVDKDHQVIDIVFWSDKKGKKTKAHNLDNPVVIMAGGKGTRLDPYTKILPKPLIPIGDMPIVERIMEKFHEYGCQDFFMTVNYKKNMIKAYFNETEKAYKIAYIDEEKPLGTAGSLHLLKNQIRDTFFLSNCDILIEGDYAEMLRHHKEQKAKITLITSLKHYTIPYGVIELGDESNLIRMQEKPEYNFLVNTGMYILEPDVIEDIPEDTFFHITDLINNYIEKGKKIAIYPVSEEAWMDMGQFKEMEIMLERLGIK